MDNQVPAEGGSSEPVPTKRCGTCERDIEVPKFRMHEIGCARSNYKCAVCGEIVAKSEKEEHDKEENQLKEILGKVSTPDYNVLKTCNYFGWQ